jgi:hypothetical protein
MERGMMLVTKLVMAQIIAAGFATDGIAVSDSLQPQLKEHRFYGKDLSNIANQPVKSSYNAKQRKRKNARRVV